MSAAPKPAGSHGVLHRWSRALWTTVQSGEGYLLLGKIVFNGLAVIAAVLTVFSLLGSMMSAQRQELKQESARLSEALYSDEPGKRLEALRDYGAFVGNFGSSQEALDKARYALIDYFARWRNGRLSAPADQKTLELEAAWHLAFLIRPQGWYRRGGEAADPYNFSWIEVDRPIGWNEDADPRTLFRAGEFSHVDLADLDLSCLDLGGVNLTEGKLTHITALASKLGQAQLINASMSNVKMQGINAIRADFSLATITESNFSTIVGDEVACGGAGIHSRTSDLSQAFFQDASLTGVKLAGARLDVTDFSNALLSGVDFSMVSGSDVSFRETIIDAANFGHAGLIRSDFSGAKIGRTSFEHATLAGSSFAGATFLDVSSEESLLRADDLTRVNISGAIFSNPQLTCRLLARGAVLVSDYKGWNDAGRPQRAWAYASNEDRVALRACHSGRAPPARRDIAPKSMAAPAKAMQAVAVELDALDSRPPGVRHPLLLP